MHITVQAKMTIWGDVETGNKFRAKIYAAYDLIQLLGWEWNLALSILATDSWKTPLIVTMELSLLNTKIFWNSILTYISKSLLSFLMVTLEAGLISNHISLTQISSWDPALANVVSLPKLPASLELVQIERAPFSVLSPSCQRMKIFVKVLWVKYVLTTVDQILGQRATWKTVL